MGNMHGNEVVGRVMLLNLAELLCRNYDKDLMLTLFINNTRIHLMPTMNPDGFATASAGWLCKWSSACAHMMCTSHKRILHYYLMQ